MSSVLEVVPKMPLSEAPTDSSDAIAAIEMRAAMSPYSMATAPERSLNRRLNNNK